MPKVAELVDRYATTYHAGHPKHLGPLTLRRVADQAGKAGRITTIGDDGGVHTIDLAACVAAALLVDHGGIATSEMAAILGRPPVTCQRLQHLGRGWLQAYEAALAKKQNEVR